MDPRLSWFAMGSVFGLVLCGWPWHPRFSRYSCRRITTCGGGEITRAEWEAMHTLRPGSNSPPPGTKPQFPPARIISVDGTTIGYRPIPPRQQPTTTRAMTFPPLSEQNCGNCRYFSRDWPVDQYCHRNPPQIGPHGGQWPQVDRSDWCGEWVAREVEP